MVIYLLVDIIIAFFYLSSSNRRPRESGKYFFAFVAIFLILVSSIRGNFTTDYDNYVLLYNNYAPKTFFELLSTRKPFDYPEIGYLLFQSAVEKLTGNVLFVFFFASLIIVIPNVITISKEKELSLLAILLFVEIGQYYVSFNIMRQIMAASIVVAGSKFLYEKRLIPFTLLVVIASLFHTSALIMLPFYFFSHIKLKKAGMILYVLACTAIVIGLPQIIAFVERYYWSWYGSEGYGMQGYSIKNIIAELGISLLGVVLFLVQRRKNKEEINMKTNVWFNASLLMIFFLLLGLRVSTMKRFVSFFSLYSILLACHGISKCRSRNLLYGSIAILCIVYGFVTKLSYPYYFFWQNT